MSALVRRAAPWAAALVGVTALVMLLFARSAGRVPDDAFIFFRYARNVADGAGWVYNPSGSSANGATSPLWVVVLAAAHLIRRDMESNGWILYSLCLAGTALTTFAGLRRLGRTAAGACAAALVVLNPVLLWIRGMESALFLLLAAGLLLRSGLDAEEEPSLRQDLVAGVLAGLLVLVRPDGAVLVLVVAAIRWHRRRRIPWVLAASAAAVTIPWVVFSTITFGSPVSGTLSAKMAQGRSGFWGDQWSFLRYLGVMGRDVWTVLMAAFAVPGLVSGLRSPSTRRYVGAAVAFAVVQFALYAFVVRPPQYHWYYAVTYWVLAILAGLGVAATAELVVSRVGSLAEGPARSRAAVLVAAVLTAVLGVVCLAGQVTGDSYRGYELAGRWIAERTDADASVAAAEIGVIGWESGRPVVDYLGLLSEVSAEEVGRGDLRSWIDREQPDLYVQHVPVWEMEEPSITAEWFPRAYRPVYESPTRGWSRVRVFERVRTREEALEAPDRVLLTPTLQRAVERRAGPLTPERREALGALLEVYLGDVALQERLELPGEGIDVVGLVEAGVRSQDRRLTVHGDVLRAMARQLQGQTLRSRLAPTSG